MHTCVCGKGRKQGKIIHLLQFSTCLYKSRKINKNKLNENESSVYSLFKRFLYFIKMIQTLGNTNKNN